MKPPRPPHYPQGYYPAHEDSKFPFPGKPSYRRLANKRKVIPTRKLRTNKKKI